MKNTLLLTGSSNILVRLPTVNMKNCLAQKSENVRSHYSQYNRENATPSSGTSALASYKEEFRVRVRVRVRRISRYKTPFQHTYYLHGTPIKEGDHAKYLQGSGSQTISSGIDTLTR